MWEYLESETMGLFGGEFVLALSRKWSEVSVILQACTLKGR